jgi:hypothetical protein
MSAAIRVSMGVGELAAIVGVAVLVGLVVGLVIGWRR